MGLDIKTMFSIVSTSISIAKFSLAYHWSEDKAGTEHCLLLVISFLNNDPIEIKKSEEKVNELDEKLGAKDCTSSDLFQCDFCEYYDNSKAVLMCHLSIKHKQKNIEGGNHVQYIT